MLHESFYQAGRAGAKHGLVIDCSDKRGFMLLFDKTVGEFIDKKYWEHPEKHSSKISEAFREIKEKNKELSLSFILFVSGPGSFTGLRVGAAFIKALSFSLGGVPIITVSKFSILATKVISEKQKLDYFKVFVPSIGNKFFMAEFSFIKDKWHQEIDYAGAKARDFLPSQNNFVSDVNKFTKDVEEIKYKSQTFEDFFKSSFYTKQIFDIVKYLDLYPMYLRRSEAEEKHRYDEIS